MRRITVRLTLLVLGLLCLIIAPALGQPAETSTRLLFLRHGDLWSAAPNGSDQRIAIASGGSINRYQVERAGDRVAVVRRVGTLDALEVHNLTTHQVTLVQAADGLIEEFAWGYGGGAPLGYVSRAAQGAAGQVLVSNGIDPPVVRHRLTTAERVMALYPAQGGVTLISKDAIGLHWTLCTLQDKLPVQGFPGKTITAMPLKGGGWLTSLYNPGSGRSLQILAPAGRTLATKYALDLPRLDLSWSTRPEFRSGSGQVLKAIVRTDSYEVASGETTHLVLWDIVNEASSTIPLPGQVLLGTPHAEPGGTQFVICTQFRDGAGYGTAPAIWSYNWRGEEGHLLVAEGSAPQWWVPALAPPEPELVPDPVLIEEPAPEEEVPAEPVVEEGPAEEVPVEEVPVEEPPLEEPIPEPAGPAGRGGWSRSP